MTYREIMKECKTICDEQPNCYRCPLEAVGCLCSKPLYAVNDELLYKVEAIAEAHRRMKYREALDLCTRGGDQYGQDTPDQTER